MADKYNAVVAGGGPSGSIAAKTLAGGGVKVVLVEKDFKRIKPCGGATPSRNLPSPGTRKLLKDFMKNLESIFLEATAL